MRDLYDFSAEDIKDILVKECLKDEKAKELFESIMHDLMVQARAGVKESFLTFEDTAKEVLVGLDDKTFIKAKARARSLLNIRGFYVNEKDKITYKI
jgi:hypothetical protein